MILQVDEKKQEKIFHTAEQYEAMTDLEVKRLTMEEIDFIRSKKNLHPGHASKLRGKLFFLTSSLFGRVGRAFMKPLSEVQYLRGGRYTKGAKFKDYLKQEADDLFVLTRVLEEALVSWRSILDKGKPRPILERRPGPADAVVFSDGAGPTEDEPDVAPKIGAVLFAWWREAPVAFGVNVDQDMMDKGQPRKNQIAMTVHVILDPKSLFYLHCKFLCESPSF